MLLYVDDMLIASENKFAIKALKDSLSGEFEIKDFRKASRILGMDITHDRRKEILRLSQAKYLEKVLKFFGMFEARSVVTHIASYFKLNVYILRNEQKSTSI